MSNKCALFVVIIFLAGVSVGWCQVRITSFSPLSGPVGTSVVITGSGFSETVSGNSVFFGATRAAVTTATATSLTVVVPFGATYHPLSVVSNGSMANSKAPFVVTFNSNPTGIDANSFAPKADITMSGVHETALADFNLDGKPDLVSTSFAVRVMRNVSTGPGVIAFAEPDDFPGGNGAGPIGIGDFDNDGRLDMVVGNSNTTTVSVFRNTTSTQGSVSFTGKVDYTVGSSPNSLAVRDLDGDGKLDIAVANSYDHTVSLLRNTSVGPGSITFASKIDVATGNSPTSIAIGDLDDDGRPDLITANYSGNTLSIFRNTSSAAGAITLAAREDIGTNNPYKVGMGDQDGDGKADVVVSGGEGVLIFRNISTSAGDIEFEDPLDISSIATFDLAISDLSGDGKMDILIVNRTQATISVFQNTSSGAGGLSYGLPVDYGVGTLAGWVTIGDMDANGKPDIAVVNEASATISFLRNNIKALPTIAGLSPASGPVGTSVVISGDNFSPIPEYNTVYFGPTSAVVDAASEITLEVTVPAGATYQSVSVITDGLQANSGSPFLPVFHNDGTGIHSQSLSEKSDYAVGAGVAYVAIGDLDRDGRSDAVVANQDGNSISVLLNSSPGAGSIELDAKKDFATANGPVAVAVGDLDGDGMLDIAVANFASSVVSIFRNTSGGPGTFSLADKVDFASGANPQHIAMGDVDLDGRLDLVTSNYGDGTASVLRNISTGFGSINFESKRDFTADSAPWFVAIRDLNADAKPDVVIANFSSDNVSVLKNISTESGTVDFAPQLKFSTGQMPGSVAIGDLNDDGKPDLAVTNYLNETVSIFSNVSTGDGTINFAQKVDFTTGVYPFFVSMADLDGDGKTDLAIANNQGNSVSLMKNNSTGVDGLVFGDKVDFATAGQSFTVAVADLDNDGKPDVVVGNYEAPLSVFRNLTKSPPVVSTFEPVSGRTGVEIIITGDYFDTTPENNIVKLNGVQADVIASTGSSITITVPPDAITGKITVTVDGLTGTSAVDFTFIPPPSIQSIEPLSGSEGTAVVITGTNFDELEGNNIVMFNGVAASVSGSTATSIHTTVPAGATSGKITVTVGGETATSASDFTVLPIPSISSFDPTSGLEGAVVVITGTNFDATPGNNTVSFNGTNAVVTASTTTTITTSVPAGATTGPVSVTVNGVTGVSAGDFTVKVDTTPPVVTDGTESSVAPGTAITISAQITDPETAITNAVVEFRSMAAGGEMTTAALTADGSTYTSQVPGAQVGELGIEYRIKATSKGGEYTSPVRTVQLVNATGVQIPYTSFGKEQSNYRIIAIPLDLTEKGLGNVFDELGTYDKTKWRMYRYNIGQTAELNIGTQVLPGFGYWLIAKSDPGVAIRSGAGKTVQAATDEPFEIDLRADWNQIGNPYDFNISWEDVQAANPGLPGLRIFNGDFADGAILNRMEGGFVKVTTAQKLRFPVVKNPGVQAGRGKHETGGLTNPLDGNNWQVYFTIEQGGLSNRISGFGMNKKASEGFDPLDGFNMPRFFDYAIQLNHSKKEGEDFYSSDIVPPANEYEWNFEIVASDEGTPVTLSWNNSYFGSRGPDLYLWDESLHRAIDMRAEDHYVFHPDMSSAFRILYGPPSFVEERTRVDNLTLHAAWPVPVDDYFTVSLSLPDSPQERAVNVAVFDLVGRSVIASESRLAGGYHEIGLARTAQMRAGIYLLNVSDGKTTSVKRIVFK